ncbi:hypothetical protein PFLUV_G00248330 [Perca fluviatilis]|uniref:Uncharacterized protein n=1 Tax=Perca fluviatilis TaxID=8168 RepID=A0A6A5DQE8_PERFL|nr:hypothetical protein PFLUV_G00248330 [Perca fluviatilis]
MQHARFPPAMLEEDPMSPQRHLTLPCPVLRQQQREDGAFNQPSPATAASYSATAPPGSFNTLNRADETTHELFVVFNVVQEDGNVASKHDQKKELLHQQGQAAPSMRLHGASANAVSGR